MTVDPTGGRASLLILKLLCQNDNVASNKKVFATLGAYAKTCGQFPLALKGVFPCLSDEY